jgi:tRNA A-37 threonylcarbamoyl transferase component Bud32
MGAVFLADVVDLPATDEEAMPAQIAVKIMPGTGETNVSAPRAEIGVMKALRHPNVVRLYDYSFDKTMSFAVMDYFARGSLLDRIRSTGPLTVEDGCALLADILSALVESHSRGILHLDIKPANVLVSDDGRYLLTDFGIAGTLFQNRAKKVVGTPAFMSPEQARGEMDTLDARSDLFMLGTTVWQALTGDFSVQRRTPQVVLRERKTQGFPKLAGRVPDDVAPLVEIVDELLEFDPRNRPGTAAEVLHRVKSIDLDGGGVSLSLSPWSSEGRPLPLDKAYQIEKGLTDPLLRDLLKMDDTFFELKLYEDMETICTEGEHSFHVYVLLKGEVVVLRNDRIIALQNREGTILGEVAALVGSPRNATLRASGETALAVFKGAELEQAARRMPALALRIMKNLAGIIALRDRIQD